MKQHRTVVLRTLSKFLLRQINTQLNEQRRSPFVPKWGEHSVITRSMSANDKIALLSSSFSNNSNIRTNSWISLRGILLGWIGLWSEALPCLVKMIKCFVLHSRETQRSNENSMSHLSCDLNRRWTLFSSTEEQQTVASSNQRIVLFAKTKDYIWQPRYGWNFFSNKRSGT